MRLCAEDPAKEFVPSAGPLDLLWWPTETEGLRVDRGFETGDRVPAPLRLSARQDRLPTGHRVTRPSTGSSKV
ncbi:MAG: hypothetical protein WDO56_27660 [Gammaproteobacteria bacterium]